MRTASHFSPAHDVKQPISFPRRMSAPGFCIFASLTPNEGWAERRETFGCSAEHPWGVPSAHHKTRVNALVTRHARRLARRLASHDAGRSPLGAPPWRFWASGPRFRLLRRPPSYNGGHLPCGSVQRAPRSQVVVPGGRLPGPPGASGYEPPAAGRHSSLRLQDVSGRRPSKSEDGKLIARPRCVVNRKIRIVVEIALGRNRP